MQTSLSNMWTLTLRCQNIIAQICLLLTRVPFLSALTLSLPLWSHLSFPFLCYPRKYQIDSCWRLTSVLVCLHHCWEVMGHLEDSSSSCSFESENRRRCNFLSGRPRWALKIIRARAYSLENEWLIKGAWAKKFCDLVRGHLLQLDGYSMAPNSQVYVSP